MTDDILIAAPRSQPEPEFRKDLPNPPDRAVAVFCRGKLVDVLQHIGPGFHYLDNHGDLRCHLEDGPSDDADGLFVFEGFLKSGQYDTPDGYEYDEWLEGSWRELTDEELETIAIEDILWDQDLWLEEGWRELLYAKVPSELKLTLADYIKNRDAVGIEYVRDLEDVLAEFSTSEKKELIDVLRALVAKEEESDAEGSTGGSDSGEAPVARDRRRKGT